MKVHILTYGCTANRSDSEIMESLLLDAGHKITGLNEADAVVVNSCSVKTPTEEKIINRIKKLHGKKVVVAGCLPRTGLERIRKECPDFSAVLDTKSLGKINAVLERMASGEGNIVEFSDEVPDKPSMLPDKRGVSGIVQISEGCNLSCAYCSTRIARGSLHSYGTDGIVKAVERLVSSGSREILLTSQDNGSYCSGGVRLPELVERVTKVDGDFMVRVGMINPMYLKNFVYDLVKAYRNPKVYKFLHLPVQSGSDNVLTDMRRGYKSEDFLGIVKKFRRGFQEITLSTDVIVGFPGETERDFLQTMEVIREARPDVVNISRFWKRPGTAAAVMKQVGDGAVRKRGKALKALAREISRDNNRILLGRKFRVLVTERGKKKGQWLARSPSYRPVIISSGKNLMGKFVTADITGFADTYLNGEIRSG